MTEADTLDRAVEADVLTDVVLEEDTTPADEWFAVLYPQTGALRLYASERLAATRVARADLLLYGYRSPLDLQARHDHLVLEKLWMKVLKGLVLGLPRSCLGPGPREGEFTPPDCDTEELARRLWVLMQRLGDRVHRAISPRRRQNDDYHIDVDRIKAVLAAGNHGYPRQCRVIVEALRDLGERYATEEQLKKMMLTLVAAGKLRTRQDHWLIFAFYRAKMMSDGLFSRGNQDVFVGDDAGEE